MHFTVIGFKDVFGKNEERDIVKMIEGISPQMLLLTFSKISGLLLDKKDCTVILRTLTGNDTVQKYPNYLSKIINKLNSSENNRIFNHHTNFEFLKIIINNYSHLESKHIKNEDFPWIETTLFAAYLQFNEIAYGSNKDPFPDIEDEYFYEFSQIILIKKTIEYQSKKDFYVEFFKIKSLLNYYYQNDSDLLNDFYKQRSIINPDVWLLEILKLSYLKDNDGNHVFYFSENHWLENYATDTSFNKFFDKNNIK